MESRYALQTLAHTQATEAEQKKEILREGFFSRIVMQDLTPSPHIANIEVICVKLTFVC
jgi:hypothetical protein